MRASLTVCAPIVEPMVITVESVYRPCVARRRPHEITADAACAQPSPLRRHGTDQAPRPRLAESGGRRTSTRSSRSSSRCCRSRTSRATARISSEMPKRLHECSKRGAFRRSSSRFRGRTRLSSARSARRARRERSCSTPTTMVSRSIPRSGAARRSSRRYAMDRSKAGARSFRWRRSDHFFSRSRACMPDRPRTTRRRLLPSLQLLTRSVQPV